MITPQDGEVRMPKGKPALIIHASDDKLMGRSHADRLVAASGGDLWIVQGAVHANAFGTEPDAYIKHLVDFAQKLPN